MTYFSSMAIMLQNDINKGNNFFAGSEDGLIPSKRFCSLLKKRTRKFFGDTAYLMIDFIPETVQGGRCFSD
jgi:hypothetical protein